MTTQFITPVGRLVQGDLLTAQTTDSRGAPLVIKTGPNAGKPSSRFFFALAIPKTDPAFPALRAQLEAEARAGYPAYFNAAGQCTHPRFAWKISDGDGIDNNGASNADKQGFAGCWVLKFSSSFAPKVIMNGQYVNDAAVIKRGYFVRVAGNCAPNIGAEVPGIYLNHDAVEFIAYGEEIKGGIDAIGLFAAAPTMQALPAGASLTPPTPAHNGSLPPLPAAPAFAPAAPAAPVVPNAAFVAAALPPPPAPAAPVYLPTAAAQGFSVEQWIAAGHTIDSLLANGMFTAG